jgi:mannose-6-phosphate isomerase-like protein (cupin superfamily)
MANRQVSREEMLERVAVFRSLSPGKRPLVDAVLPQFQREIFNVIGGGVTEDPTMQVGIRAVEGFHMAIIRAEPGKGTGLHNHKTVEVFMPLTGRWSVQWGDAGEHELTLDQYDVISVPVGVMRGFRNEGAEAALLLSIVGGTDPGKVDWAEQVRADVRARGFDLDDAGRIIELPRA